MKIELNVSQEEFDELFQAVEMRYVNCASNVSTYEGKGYRDATNWKKELYEYTHKTMILLQKVYKQLYNYKYSK